MKQLISIDETQLEAVNGGFSFQVGGGLSFNDKPVVGGAVGASVGDGGAQVAGQLQLGKHTTSGGISLGFF